MTKITSDCRMKAKKIKKSLYFESVSDFSIFLPKSWCFLKKKSSPKVGNYFLHLMIVAALKFHFCPNFSYHYLKDSGFAQIFPSRCPKNYDFAQILETWEGQSAPCSPGRYGHGGNLFSIFVFLF